MRISFKEAEQKRNFARELFRKGLNGAQVQSRIVAQFGQAMRRNSLYRIRKETEVTKPSITDVTTTEVTTIEVGTTP